MNELDQILADLSNAERNALAWVCSGSDEAPPSGMVGYLTKLVEKNLVERKYRTFRDIWTPTMLGLEIREKIARGI
jgi:hypothetical protein